MTIVFKVGDNVKEKVIKYYENLKREKTPPYAIFQAEEGGTIITLYESGKLMFQGISADIDADIWITMEKNLNGRKIDPKSVEDKKQKDKLIKIEEPNYNQFNTIGSDEVGTGDYFGPIVVVSTYVSKENQDFLKNLGVTDSKKITDDKIKKIAPEIIKTIPYSAYILSNEEYNRVEHKEVNLNKIKAILHNKVLCNLEEKDYAYDMIVVDQFTTPSSYFNYLKDVPIVIRKINFTPRAEIKCLSVACASIISRFIFLREMEKMEQTLGKEIPKGAGIEVIEFTQNLINEQGFDILNKYCKLNFKITEKLTKE